MQSQIDVVWDIYGIGLEISVWGNVKSTKKSVTMLILGRFFSNFSFLLFGCSAFLPALHCDRIALAQSLARCCSKRQKSTQNFIKIEAENVTLCPLTVLVYSLELLKLFES